MSKPDGDPIDLSILEQVQDFLYMEEYCVDRLTGEAASA